MNKSQILIFLTAAAFTAGSTQAALVAEWTFDDMSNPSDETSTFDDQVDSVTSEAIGSGISVSTDTAAPGSTQSLSFDGSGFVSTTVDGNSLGIEGTVAKTITGWFKTSSTGRQVIVDFTLGDNGEDLRVVYDPFGSGDFAAGTGLRLELSGGAAAIHDASGGDNSADLDLNDDQWHFFAAIIPTSATGQDIDFYIDGTIYGDTLNSTTAVSTGNGTFAFGDDSRGAISNLFNGWLDDIRVYNTALTKSELDSVYAIPEPSAALLSGFVALLLLGRRRR